MPLSGFEKTLIKQIGILATSLVKKQILKKNIEYIRSNINRLSSPNLRRPH